LEDIGCSERPAPKAAGPCQDAPIAWGPAQALQASCGAVRRQSSRARSPRRKRKRILGLSYRGPGLAGAKKRRRPDWVELTCRGLLHPGGAGAVSCTRGPPWPLTARPGGPAIPSDIECSADCYRVGFGFKTEISRCALDLHMSQECSNRLQIAGTPQNVESLRPA
jgi:hypothetical protein